MCATCETLICVLFDNLVRDYFRDFPVPQEDVRARRPTYMRLDVRNAEESAATKTGFKAMVEAATGIGYEPGEFLAVLAEKSGFKDHVHNWARGTIPNGLARKVILTCAENIIRERGAQPTLSLLAA